MRDYVEVIYNQKERPYGEYPLQLVGYFVRRFHLKKGMRILDNGCGRGEFLHAFSRFGMKVSGTDGSGYCRDAKVVDLNTENLPFPDNYFDVVFSKSVIEHIENTQHYMEEMRRVLTRGGILILMVPDWESQYKIFYRDPTHIHPYTVKSVESLLVMFGYRDVKAERFIQLPCTWNNPFMKALSMAVRRMGPANRIYKNKFIRFSRELMVLGSGRKL